MGAPHSKRRGHGSAGKRRTHYEDPIAAIDFARRSGGIEADISRAAGERMIGRRSTASGAQHLPPPHHASADEALQDWRRDGRPCSD